MWFGRCEDGGGDREEVRGAGGSRRDARCGESSFGERGAGAAVRRSGEDRKDGSAGGERGAEHPEERNCWDGGDAGGGSGKAGRRQVGGADARRRVLEKCEGLSGTDAAASGDRMEAAA